ncbi:hypothetical protein Y032_0558g3416 [Ancylostoma ceylanicum]|uniref:Uncharacterized protein n=1 Tax=Ancylostoma ceylanicum TaxID=53326 RepID=A0A016WPJ2_9BILA|nr:hypothetical protein Y032_0558g3416 [Ancylostoma ceylanicum]
MALDSVRIDAHQLLKTTLPIVLLEEYCNNKVFIAGVAPARASDNRNASESLSVRTRYKVFGEYGGSPTYRTPPSQWSGLTPSRLAPHQLLLRVCSS